MMTETTQAYRGSPMEREARTTRPIRMTDAEWAGFKDLLGPEWLRGQVEKAIQRDKRKAKQE